MAANIAIGCTFSRHRFVPQRVDRRHNQKAIPPAPYYRAINANTPQPKYSRVYVKHDVQALSSASPEPPARSHHLLFLQPAPHGHPFCGFVPVPAFLISQHHFNQVIALLIERRNQTGQSKKVCNRRDAAGLSYLAVAGT